MDFGQIAANAVGIIEKALICFNDNRKSPDQYKTNPAANKGVSALKGGLKDVAVSKKASILKGADAVLKGGGLSGAVNYAASMGVGQKNGELKSDDTHKYFRVQFNPSTFSITSNVDDPALRPKDSATNEDALGKDDSVYSELNVQLIFDDTDKDEAFTESRITSSLLGGALLNGASISSVYNVGKSLIGGERIHTVRPQVEAFVGAARTSELKKVDFIWADMLLTGTLVTLKATYTMFNPQGEPIRATVDLGLVLDTTIDADQDPIGIYRPSYDQVFGNGDFNAGSALQKVGNILHF